MACSPEQLTPRLKVRAFTGFELGDLLGRAHRGQGYANGACRAALAEAARDIDFMGDSAQVGVHRF